MEPSINALQNTNLTIIYTAIVLAIYAIGMGITIYKLSLDDEYNAENETTSVVEGEMSKHDLGINS
jgi:cytochrome c biogenesis protein CcdA